MKALLAHGSWIGLSVAVLASGAAADEPQVQNGPPPVQYNFAPPGARSLAMGAAFIGLADDATASASNPAGLTILTKPEFSAHFRYSSYDTDAPNTVLGTGFQTFNDKLGSPSFFSFVYPLKGAAFSVYYQRSSDFKSHSFFDGVIPGTTLPNYDEVDTQFKVENLGVSGAFKLGKILSIGGSVQSTRVSIDSLQKTTFPDSVNGVLFRGYVAPDASQSKVTWNAGVLLTPISQVSIGGVYKAGARYGFSTDFVVDVTDGVDTADISRQKQPIPIRIPDVYGVGLALRPTESLTFVADVVEVKYVQADPGPLFENLYQQNGQGGREPLADGTEFHAGAEYTWAKGTDWLFAARLGYYSDPDHDGLAGLDSKQDHFTAGGGVVVKNRLQIDVAGNFAKNIKEALLSFVVRF